MSMPLPAHPKPSAELRLVVLGAGVSAGLLSWLSLYDELMPAARPVWLVLMVSLWCLGALAVVPAAVWADRAVARGRAPWLSYSAALFAAIGVSQCVAVAGWGCASVLARRYQFLAPVLDILPQHFFQIAIEQSIYGGLYLLYRYNRLEAQRMFAAVQHSEHIRLRDERRALDYRIATAEARMDSAKLLDALRSIRVELQHSPALAEARLVELMNELRRALAQTVAVDHGESLLP